MEDRESPDRLAPAILGLVALLYLYFPNANPALFTPNDLSRIYLTQAIVEEGRFEIDRAVARHGPSIDLAYFGGHYYSDKAIGVSLLSVPVYGLLWTLGGGALGEREILPACRAVVVTLPSLLFVFWLLRRWRGEGSLGRVLVLGLALGTSFFPYAIDFLGHSLQTALLFWIYWRVAEEPPARPSPAYDAVTGALCAVAVLVDYTSGVFVVLAGLYLLWKNRSAAQLAWLTAGALPLAAVLLVYNYLCFGDPFDLAYNHMLMEADRVNRTTGFFGIGLPRPPAVWGLTLGLSRGLFVHSPVFLLLVPALWALGRPWRWEGRHVLAGAAALAYFWLNASLIDWQGGWSLGPRYLMPLFPFATLLVLRGAARESAARRRRYLLFAVAAVTWSGLLHLAGAGTWLHPPHAPLRFATAEMAAYMLAHGVAGQNLGLLLGLGGVLSLVPAAALFATALALGVRTETRRARLRLAGAAAGAAALLVAAMAAAYAAMDAEQIEMTRSLTAWVVRSLHGV